MARFGFWASLGTAGTTLVAFCLAIGTPPVSGPFCRANCIEYPFAEIAARFPRDYVWMVPAMASASFFLASMVGLYGRAPAARRPIAAFSVVLASMATFALVGDYFVQLTVVQPSVLAGEIDGIALLSQYNPHGLFIAFEELGYLLMAASLACMAPAMRREALLERVARALFVGAFVLDVVVFAWIAWRFGHAREYRFEVAVIAIDWIALIVGSSLLAAVLRRDHATANV